MSGVAIISRVELTFDENVNLPRIKLQSVPEASILKTDKSFDIIDFVNSTGKYSQQGKSQKGTKIYTKLVQFDVSGVDLETIKKIKKFEIRQLSARVITTEGDVILIRGLSMETDEVITETITKGNTIRVKLTSKSLLPSIFVV